MKYLFDRFLQYIKNVLVGFDLFVNGLTFGNPRETISHRLGKWKSRSKLARIICRIMTNTLFGELHCDRAFKEPGKGEAINDSPLAGVGILILIISGTLYLIY